MDRHIDINIHCMFTHGCTLHVDAHTYSPTCLHTCLITYELESARSIQPFSPSACVSLLVCMRVIHRSFAAPLRDASEGGRSAGVELHGQAAARQLEDARHPR